MKPLASSPDAVVDEAQRHQFDLILIDLNDTCYTTSGQEGLNQITQLRQNAARRARDRDDGVETRGWYHSFRFPGGTAFESAHAVELSEDAVRGVSPTADLTGKTLLDIGAWDGGFSFEAERHGAAVTAIDTAEVANFWKVPPRYVKRCSRSLTAHEERQLVPSVHVGLEGDGESTGRCPKGSLSDHVFPKDATSVIG